MRIPKQELTFFESIKNGLKEVVAWKRGKDTGAIVHAYTAIDLAKIRNKKSM